MYSKQEAASLKREFWTALGLYMRPVQSAGGEPVNWVNYKTGQKHIYFRAQADTKSATIAIELHHPNAAMRQLYFEQFIQLKSIFEQLAGTGWAWQTEATDDYGKTISRIYKTEQPLSVYKREDWPALISFFKQGLIELDRFWSEAKYAFEDLR